MKGLYLYCLRKKNPAAVKAVKTIDKGEVYTVSYKELEAVVSPVDLKEFSSEEIQKKAQGDINWIKGKAQIHEYVIEQAMGVEGKIIPVIPMKFGIIFKTKENLEEMIGKRYAKFKASLKDLEGKQEWGVKVYLNEDVFEKQLKDTSEVVVSLLPLEFPRGDLEPVERSNLTPRRWRKKSLPKGMDFFAKKQMEELMEKAKARKLQEVAEKIFADLRGLALEANQGKNLAEEITGKKEPMVLNANFLIKEEKVEEFQRETDELKANYKKLGLIIQESGPWPPYNFV